MPVFQQINNNNGVYLSILIIEEKHHTHKHGDIIMNERQDATMEFDGYSTRAAARVAHVDIRKKNCAYAR